MVLIDSLFVMFYRARTLVIYEENGEVLADDRGCPILVTTERPGTASGTDREEAAANIEGNENEDVLMEEYLTADEHFVFGVNEESESGMRDGMRVEQARR